MTTQDAADFLTALYGGDYTTSFLCIDEKKDRKPECLPPQQRRGTFAELKDELAYLNQQGYGVFFHVNPVDDKGFRAENVVAPVFCFVDSDDGPIDPDTMPLAPSFIVHSSRGDHLYWRLEDGSSKKHWSEVQERLNAKLGTDPRITNLNRVMRLPGFDHQKGDPHPVTWGVFDDEAVYGYTDIVDAFGLIQQNEPPAPPPAPEWKEPSATNASPADATERCRRYVERIEGAVEGAHGDDATFRVACVIINDFGLTDEQAWPILCEFNGRCSPPWGHKDLEAKLRHARKYSSHPPGEKRDAPGPGPGNAPSPGTHTEPGKDPGSGASGKPDPRLAFHTPSDAADQWLEQGDLVFIPSHVPALNAALGGGFSVNAVTTILAYTGCYKSEFARHAIRHASNQGYPAYHVDVELGLMHLMERHIAQLSGVLPTRLRQKKARSEADNEAITKAIIQLRSERWRVQCPGGGLPLETLETTILRGLPPRRDSEPALIVLDSAQRLAHGVAGEDARGRVDKFFVWAENLAKRLHAAVLVIHEQSRSATGGTPSVGSLLTSGAESRSIEYTSSGVLGLYPDHPKLEEDTIAGDADDPGETPIAMVIAKNRSGGSIGYLDEVMVMEKPYWRMSIRPRSHGLADKLRHLMEPGKPYSLNAVHKLCGGRKANAKKAVHELNDRGLVLKAQYADKPPTFTLRTDI